MAAALIEPSTPLAPADFRLFQDLAYRHAGIRLADGKMSLVQNRLQRRLRLAGKKSYREYHDLVSTAAGAVELQHCIEALTTNETFFFRHKDHWDFFIGTILGTWDRRKTLRVWSAAASTGEEAHSTAIACLEHARDARVLIEGTDINGTVLETAKRGIYGEYAVQKITDYARNRWLTKVADGWQVKDGARKLITWRRHNILERADGQKQDAVFLRNVLIYFDEASKAKALTQVVQRMNPGAWLFLGGSEAVSDPSFGLVPVRPQIYRKA